MRQPYLARTLFLFLVGIAGILSLSAQVDSLQPQILSQPNLNPDTLQKYEDLHKEFLQLQQDEVTFDAYTERQKQIFADELFHLVGPYSTEPLGCSWYCGNGPSRCMASTKLDSTRRISYAPNKVHDFDLRTAWVEGAKGHGIGESVSLEFQLSSQQAVTHLLIYNGYSKSLQTWKANGRVKTFVVFANGKKVAILNLENTYYGQDFHIGSLGGDENGKLVITMKILAVYPGEQYEDTAISEVNVEGTGVH